MEENKRVKQKQEKGFTLIELLLVIAIIAILAAAVVVGLQRYRESANVSNVFKAAAGINPFVVECYMRGQALVSPAANQEICVGSTMQWPDVQAELVPSGATTLNCQYGAAGDGLNTTNANMAWVVECNTTASAGNDPQLICYAADGKCVQQTGTF